jgi:hypothetical protein
LVLFLLAAASASLSKSNAKRSPTRHAGRQQFNIDDVFELERFRAKWIPVRVKKTRQNKNLEPVFDSIKTE